MSKISTQFSVKKIERIIFALAIIFFIVSGWAALTKAGVIPNYLKIRFLHSCSLHDAEILVPQIDRDFEYEPVDRPAYKPVIYLYPEQKQLTEVIINYPGNIFVTYPKYNNGWKVIAYRDGKLINQLDGKEYSYLFWEGKNDAASYDLSSGFVVKGADTAFFLQDKLAELGLTPKEYNEFIVYWLPKMIDNKYNLIHFATKEEYDNRVILDIKPKPDSILRVFMVFKKIDTDINVVPQPLQPFKRSGFSVVEWGGTEI